MTFNLHSCINSEVVKAENVMGKMLGLYFSASWCRECQKFTPDFIQVYNELTQKAELEIIFVSADKNYDSFNKYFSQMPWLAIPFLGSERTKHLKKLFKVWEIPHLVILNENGKIVNDEYTRSYERQTLKSILVSPGRDFEVSNDGKRVPISQLEGKTVGLYFFLPLDHARQEFTPRLVESFEIVMLCLEDNDEEEESFSKAFASMPWLALPFKDKTWPDGKTLHQNAAYAIEEYGTLAYPFTPERLAEHPKIEEALQEAQTLESILVSDDQNFLIRKDGAKVLVSDLVGKNILLYFSALIEMYHKIKEKDDSFEVIFISSDTNQATFDKNFSRMPWLALPFGDKRKATLSCKLKVYSIPRVVAIGPTGQTISTKVVDLIDAYGADAYPFTNEHLEEIKAETKKN
ncbi:hypothetical protein UlMin_007514 [Ulmus minor]